MRSITSWMGAAAHLSLGIICLGLLIGFHALNVHGGQFLAPLEQWRQQIQPTRIVLSSSAGELFSFRFVTVSEDSQPPNSGKRKGKKPKKRPAAQRPKLDPANQWLAWTGLHLRAQVNQSQQRWINYPHGHKRYYFLRDEIQLEYARHEPVVEKAFHEVTQLMRKAVKDAGGTLVIAPMPTKTSIYRERLPSWLPEQELWEPVPPQDMTEDAHGVYTSARLGARREALDLFATFTAYHQRHPDDELYIPSNHQWSSLGIALTSVEVIANLRERGWDLAKPELTRLNREGELYDEGLLQILNLPPQFGRFYQQTQLREAVYGVNQVTNEESTDRLIVFGTCFSNRLRGAYGFTETLSRALRRPNAINLAAEGGKTLPSFEAFAQQYQGFKRGDLVVWEFNVRETFTDRDVQRIRRWLKSIRKSGRRAREH